MCPFFSARLSHLERGPSTVNRGPVRPTVKVHALVEKNQTFVCPFFLLPKPPVRRPVGPINRELAQLIAFRNIPLKGASQTP